MHCSCTYIDWLVSTVTIPLNTYNNLFSTEQHGDYCIYLVKHCGIYYLSFFFKDRCDNYPPLDARKRCCSPYFQNQLLYSLSVDTIEGAFFN